MPKKRRKKETKIVDAKVSLALFDLGGTLKEQGVKILEESAEVFGALQKHLADVEADSVDQVSSKWRVLDEVADVLQATANLLYIMGFDQYDVREAMMQCAKKNKERGRL